jgi:hypothetical protein
MVNYEYYSGHPVEVKGNYPLGPDPDEKVAIFLAVVMPIALRFTRFRAERRVAIRMTSRHAVVVQAAERLAAGRRRRLASETAGGTQATSAIFPSDLAERHLWEAAWDAYLTYAPVLPDLCTLLARSVPDGYQLA